MFFPLINLSNNPVRVESLSNLGTWTDSVLGVFLLEDWKIRGHFSSANSSISWSNFGEKMKLLQKTVSKPGCFDLMLKFLKMIVVLQ